MNIKLTFIKTICFLFFLSTTLCAIFLQPQDGFIHTWKRRTQKKGWQSGGHQPIVNLTTPQTAEYCQQSVKTNQSLRHSDWNLHDGKRIVRSQEDLVQSVYTCEYTVQLNYIGFKMRLSPLTLKTKIDALIMNYSVDTSLLYEAMNIPKGLNQP